LTAREWEVLDLMCAGLCTEDIARRLFVGAVTVRTHVSSILRKLKVEDRQSAVELFRSA
jgi:ATP/maltotriose-dependent transcriptional regulator MalT